jgi:hypothetical protein
MGNQLISSSPVAKSVPFDPSTSSLVSTNVQDAIVELTSFSTDPSVIIKKILLDTDGTKASILFDADSILYEA